MGELASAPKHIDRHVDVTDIHQPTWLDLEPRESRAIGAQGIVAVDTGREIAEVSGWNFLLRDSFHFPHIDHFGGVRESLSECLLHLLSERGIFGDQWTGSHELKEIATMGHILLLLNSYLLRNWHLFSSD